MSRYYLMHPQVQIQFRTTNRGYLVLYGFGLPRRIAAGPVACSARVRISWSSSPRSVTTSPGIPRIARTAWKSGTGFHGQTLVLRGSPDIDSSSAAGFDKLCQPHGDALAELFDVPGVLVAWRSLAHACARCWTWIQPDHSSPSPRSSLWIFMIDCAGGKNHTHKHTFVLSADF